MPSSSSPSHRTPLSGSGGGAVLVLSGTYGELLIYGNGTYVYSLNTSKAATQAVQLAGSGGQIRIALELLSTIDQCAQLFRGEIQ